MSVFFTDIWHDLREKHLLPVALVLVAALVAVPLLLAKPAPKESASISQVAAPPAKGPAATMVALAEDSTQEDSSLKLFDPRNPFAAKGVKELKALSSEDIADAAKTLLASSEDGTSGGSSGGGSSSEGTSGGGTTTPTGGDDTTPDSGGGTEVVKYSYAIDVTFTRNDHTRRVKGMKRFEMLPSEANPLLIFLGVDSSGDNAVFLVDSTLQTSGEGSCQPSPSECGVLKLGAGSEHRFVDGEGNAYTLRIGEIRKYRLRSASGSAREDAEDPPKAGASDASAVRTRRFVPPILSDLVTVASPAGDD